MHGNRGLMRMEKKAVNKFGLFLVILLALAFFGGGGYLLYKNRNNLDFSFPWEKSKKEESKEEAAERRKKVALERQKISVEISAKFKIDKLDCRILEATYNEFDGYVFKIQMYNPSKDKIVKIKYEYLIIDGYQIDYDDTIEVKPLNSLLYSLTIPTTELDKIGLETFKQLNVYISHSLDDEEKWKEQVIKINNDLYTSNTQLPKKNVNMGKVDKLSIDYYKTEETETTTDVYFVLTNDNSNVSYELTINAYKINNSIETNNDFREKIYPKCQKVIVLSIPKKDYKKVDKLTLSFFVLDNNDIYLTKTTNLDLTKN